MKTQTLLTLVALLMGTKGIMLQGCLQDNNKLEIAFLEALFILVLLCSNFCIS